MGEEIKGFPAILETYKPRKGDKSMVITFATNELNNDEKLFIMNHHEKYVHLIVLPQEMPSASMEDVAEAMVDAERFKKQGNSDSQVLRNVLFKWFMLQGGKKEDFEEFRHKQMQELINHFGDKCKKIEGQ